MQSGRAAILKLDDSTTVYIIVKALHMNQLKCRSGLLMVPLGTGVNRSEESHASDTLSIVIRTKHLDAAMDFDKVTLDYLSKRYDVESVSSANMDRMRDHRQTITRDKENWYNVTFPPKIDARNPFSISFGGFSVGDKGVPNRLVRFFPKVETRDGEYGERGC